MQGILKGPPTKRVKSPRRSTRLAAKDTKKGKEKVHERVDITAKHTKRRMSISNSNSTSSDKEEGPITKPPRKLMDKRDYKALFLHPVKKMQDIPKEEPSVNGPRMSAPLSPGNSDEPSVNSHPRRSARLSSEDA